MNKEPSKTSLIIHGHFYQPPRENPEVDLIPKQPSAKPYPDWNELIYSTCYFPNSASRYLNPYRQVHRIINNYQYISFDFGPTLMTWMKANHPDVHELIIDADKNSIERLGHGNAMAQSFNHTILPLDTLSDAKMQIDWGIDDFIRRFDRDPEGLWLPETAINTKIIDLLVSAGITFIILSPWQCAAYQDEKGAWMYATSESVPYDAPFLIEGNNGTAISAFFYHPQLASDISFGHSLQDADVLYDKLLAIRKLDNPTLLHTATDGEIYGHHEPFGDMALAALIHKTEHRNDFEFTNYAAYLSKNKATRYAKLHAGEESLGTSWSCSHGVSRWYKDCGCHTGGEQGWTQLWRTPLRSAMRSLAAQIDTIYNDSIDSLFEGTIDASCLLRSYGEVLSGYTETETFLVTHLPADRQDEKTKRTVAELLAGQKFKFYSHTSCGWFFSDLGGLEPRQNITYALKAVQLYANKSNMDLLGPLLSALSQAKSNRRSDGSGQTIAKNILAKPSGIIEAAGCFLLNREVARIEDQIDRYGKFSILSFSKSVDNWIEMELRDTSTLATYRVQMTTLKIQNDGYALDVRINDVSEPESIQSMQIATSAIPARLLDEVFTWIDHSLSSLSDDEVLSIANDIKHYSMLLRGSRSTPNELYHFETMGTCLRALRSIFTTPNTLPWDEKRESVALLLEFVQRRGKAPEILAATSIFTAELDRLANEIIKSGLTESKSKYLLDILKLARDHGLDPSITLTQNAMYPALEGYESDYLLNELRIHLNFA
ncbi:MAG: DUF3536 domain-containing protein [Sphaerochaetaceae bacterium]|nr:DUF3536 domain-containing protein [Sphaerochaetaceae bacterium]